MSVIYRNDTQDPATHAIIIGVGAYKHLLGGVGDPILNAQGSDYYESLGPLGQLTSPPISARAFATWLLKEFNNPRKPLGTLALLISDNKTRNFIVDQKRWKIDRAIMPKVMKAIEEWFKRGNENQDNLMMFYFCGHGIASGFQLSLLQEDFGENNLDPLEAAIDFDGFFQGMDRCKAIEQCYFIDACRIASSFLIRSRKSAGKPIILPDEIISSARMTHKFYSTIAGEGAYSRPKSPSYFSEALLKALEGAGSNNPQGLWQIYPRQLATGIDYYIRRITKKQSCHSDNTGEFPIHELSNLPVIPVSIGCKPDYANDEAHLSYCDRINPPVERPENLSTGWEVDLKLGGYDFLAKFQKTSFYQDNQEYRQIRPPYNIIPIKVQGK